MKPRRLTIAPLYRDNTYRKRHTSTSVLPHLRLAGRWLEQAGFEIGQNVEVQVEHGKLTITAN